MSAPTVNVSAHFNGRDLAPRTMIFPADAFRKEPLVALILGDVTAYLTQAQAADISLALTRAISDVDRAKAVAVVASVERPADIDPAYEEAVADHRVTFKDGGR